MTFPLRPPTTRWPAPPPPPQVCGWWATLPLYMADAVIVMTATAAARIAFPDQEAAAPAVLAMTAGASAVVVPDVAAAAPAVIGLTGGASAWAVLNVAAAAPAVIPIKASAVRRDAFTGAYPAPWVYPSPALYPAAGSPPPPTDFSPPDITGLGLWLDATQITGLTEGEPVTTWPDLSPSGFTATWDAASASPPVYQAGSFNGLPAVNFTATQTTAQTFRVPGWGTAVSRKTEYTLLMVALTHELASGQVPVIFTGPYETNNWTWLVEYDTNGGMFWGHGGYRRYDSLIPADVGCLLTFHYQPGAPHHFVNTTEITEFIVYAGDLAPTVPDIGPDVEISGYSGYQYGHTGLVGEIIWYDHAITDTELAQVQGYLIGKWGLSRYLGVSTPDVKPAPELPPHLQG